MKDAIRAQRALFIQAVAIAAAGMVTCTGPAAAETLEDALVAAYNTNPSLLAERARLRATDENVSQALSGWRPTISARGSYGTQSTRRASGFGGLISRRRDVTDPKSAELVLTQPVFRGFRTLNETRQAKAEVRSGRALLLSTEQQVLLDAATAYLDVVRDQEVVELSRRNVQRLEKQREAAEYRFNAGADTKTDVAQAEARLSGARSNLRQAEAQLTASREAYRRIVGQMPGTLAMPNVFPVLPEAEEEALKIGIERNPVLRNAAEAENASHYAIKVAKGALLPSIDFEASATHAEDQGVTGDQTSGYAFFSQIVIPIYQAGAEYSRIRQLKELNSADKLRVDEVRRDVKENVAVAWEALSAARAVIESSREQVRANEVALNGVQQEEQAGLRTTLDVLDAEQELLDSQVQEVRARRDEYVAAFQLLAATGQLTAWQLGLPVDYYDPTAHYEQVKWRPF